MDGSTTISNQLLYSLVVAMLTQMGGLIALAIRSRKLNGHGRGLSQEQHTLLTRMGVDGITPELRERLHFLGTFTNETEKRVALLELRAGMFESRRPPP